MPPALVPFNGSGSVGAIVLGGMWEADPVAEQEMRDKAARQTAAEGPVEDRS